MDDEKRERGGYHDGRRFGRISVVDLVDRVFSLVLQ